jgi:hypothetical protein
MRDAYRNSGRVGDGGMHTGMLDARMLGFYRNTGYVQQCWVYRGCGNVYRNAEFLPAYWIHAVDTWDT